MSSYSVIIPTRNRLPRLQRVVESVLAQQNAGAVELIVVNDGSTDATAGYLANMQQTHGVKTVHTTGLGPAKARNRGAAAATAEVLAFTDDDCVVPPTWLAMGGALLANAAAAGGSVTNALPNSRLATVYHQMAEWFFMQQNRADGAALFLTTNNFFITRTDFTAIGGFEERLYHGCEDREILLRLAAAGKRVVYAPELRIDHYHPFTTVSYLRHLFMQGGGSRRFYSLPIVRQASKHHKLPLSAYAGMLRYIAGKDSSGLFIANALLAIAGQAAVAAGYLSEGSRV